jgi:hypothetical protein
MRICSICQSGAELDDTVLTLSTDGCICLRCYCRETDSTRRMPAALRDAIEEILTTRDASASEPAPHSAASVTDHDPKLFPRNWKPWWQTLRHNP